MPYSIHTLKIYIHHIRLLPEPRPLPVSIGWVVECVEKRAHVDETRFLVNLNEIGVAGGVQVCMPRLLITPEINDLCPLPSVGDQCNPDR